MNVFIDKEFQVRVFIDINLNKEANYVEKNKDTGINLKEIRDFIFISESDFNYFLFLTKRLFFSINKANLIIELVNYENNTN